MAHFNTQTKQIELDTEDREIFAEVNHQMSVKGHKWSNSIMKSILGTQNDKDLFTRRKQNS